MHTIRGERSVHDSLVPARIAVAAAHESEVTAGFGKHVPAVEPAAATYARRN
ncbi:hypothetical protein [Streptomyces sp. NPDC047841]|uniref:hypothetical protein n=1 Tax=Streptomyces sp. NPDC047841 TaxID=3154708 RepID=UPI0034534323